MEPETLALACVFLVVNTSMLVGLLRVLRPRDEGLLPGISPRGPLVCFSASVLFLGLAIIETPWLVNVIAWFAVALIVFRLTFRQSLKLNIAQGLIFVALVFGLAAVVD